MGKENGELKLVISLKGGKASVGVQAPGCDPVFFQLEGDLDAVRAGMPGFVEEAKRRWEASKLNPECSTPLPSKVEAEAKAKASAASLSRSKPAAKQTDQTPMF